MQRGNITSASESIRVPPGTKALAFSDQTGSRLAALRSSRHRQIIAPQRVDVSHDPDGDLPPTRWQAVIRDLLEHRPASAARNG